MKNPNSNTTACAHFFIKATLLGIALLIGLCMAQCSFGQAVPALISELNVRSMVHQQPFPFGSGVAMDTLVYQSIKRTLTAADQLRKQAQLRINALESELTGTHAALDDQLTLAKNERDRRRELIQKKDDLEAELVTTTARVKAADDAFASVIKGLPHSVRKKLTGATPEQIATAVVDYVHLQQSRKWKWSAGAGIIGFVIGLAVLL